MMSVKAVWPLVALTGLTLCLLSVAACSSGTSLPADGETSIVRYGVRMEPYAEVIDAVYGKIPCCGHSSETLPETVFPDTDLHAYSGDGKHVGVNYSSDVYEVQIPGAETSYNTYNDREYIILPINTTVRFVVDASDNARFMQAWPAAAEYTDGTERYIIYLTCYDSAGDMHHSASLIESIPAGERHEYDYSIGSNPDGSFNLSVIRVGP
jgi:hypothetical protein